MQMRKLGDSDLRITPIGFGSWPIGGGGWAFAWGQQEDADSVASIHEAIDLGINWIALQTLTRQTLETLMIFSGRVETWRAITTSPFSSRSEIVICRAC
jgi:hypothetical protein